MRTTGFWEPPASVFRDRHEFLDRLVPFLKQQHDAHKFAIEIRNIDWLDVEFAELLRNHKIALVLQDRSWMPNPAELKFDPITTDWTYIRWLGDRKDIEEQTTTWDKTGVDRTTELSSWVDYCYQIRKRGVTIYAYANNHFAAMPQRQSSSFEISGGRRDSLRWTNRNQRGYGSNLRSLTRSRL